MAIPMGQNGWKTDIFQALKSINGRNHELCYADRFAAYIKLELMSSQELRQLIVDAFSSVPRPEKDAIAPHKCPECDELASDFSRFSAIEMPDEVFRRHFGDIPLLSEEALHYYLPAWLIRCLTLEAGRLPDEVSEVIHAFDCEPQSKPSSPFTRQQLQAVLGCLEHVAQYADRFDLDGLDRARKRIEYEL